MNHDTPTPVSLDTEVNTYRHTNEARDESSARVQVTEQEIAHLEERRVEAQDLVSRLDDALMAHRKTATTMTEAISALEDVMNPAVAAVPSAG